MGALPKRKISKQRKGNRRSHDALTAPTLVVCQECKHRKLAHHVCENCGTYGGVQVKQVKV